MMVRWSPNARQVPEATRVSRDLLIEKLKVQIARLKLSTVCRLPCA
jgi:hypothetical protein